MKRLALLVLACTAAAHADTIGPGPGNVLNPTPLNPTTAGRWMDEDGLGTRIPAARTPTGLLYNVPPDPGGEAEGKGTATWTVSGIVEWGGLINHRDDRRQGFLN